MTDFATPADIIAGLAYCVNAGFSQDLSKTSITVGAGYDYSGWLASGNPVAGAIPGITWVVPTAATLGALNPRYINGASTATCRILFAALRPSVANQPIIIYDRVGHVGGKDGSLSTAQTIGATLTAPAADKRCEAGGGDVEWWMEIYTALGSTGVNATFAVTYSDNSTGNVVSAVPASVPLGRMIRIPPSSANLSIKAISTVTLSATTGSVGNFGVTACERKMQFSVPTANTDWVADWATLGFPDIGLNACLNFRCFATSSALGTLTGNFKAGVK